MADFLLELLSEEIPARMQAGARDNLARLFATELAKSGLKAEALETYSTPRRLALIARNLPAATEASSEELKGPRTSAPPQALEGFLRKTGLTRDQLTDRDGVYFAIIDKPGRATSAVLAEAIPAIVRAFPWPKSMRWGAASQSTESLRWVRPLQGVIALLDGDIVPIEIDGLTSGAETVGHRFHHPGPITIGNADDYAAKLRACHVIVDHEERESIIALGATTAAAQAGLILVRDEALLRENAGLTEWPVPLLGRFDPAFLDVPPEMIQLTMATNQKYFACQDADGKLAPAFICTANIEARDGGAAIVAGNQKVLAARLADAKFFWEQDLKVPLEEQAKKLDQIVFHEKLGTVADKVERVAKLARWLVEEGIVGGSSPSSATIPARPERSRGAQAQDSEQRPSTSLRTSEDVAQMAYDAARLCKADLVTGMVGEFPELQGIMGGYYARAQGLPNEVADAIRDHYKPVGQGDDVPNAPVTVAVSLADKLDTLAGFFTIGEMPTGSRDPFALRRAALAVLELISVNKIRLNLWGPVSRLIFTIVTKRWEDVGRRQVKDAREFLETMLLTEMQRTKLFNMIFDNDDFLPDLNSDEDIREEMLSNKWAAPKIIAFLADRLKVQQREAGVRHDLIDAVFALGGEDDLVRLLARVKALQAFVETAEGRDLLAGYKRAANILKKEGFSPSPLEGEGDSRSERGEGAQSEAPASVDSAAPSPSHADAWAPPSPSRGEGKNPLSYSPAPEENALIAALDSAEPRARAAVEREDFEAAMQALATLRAPVDAFFEKVTVNDPDADKRTTRLGLLARMRDAVHQVADFSRIDG